MTPFLQTQTQMLNAIDVFTGGLALLAFVMALYVLAAREQKTPYITNSVYSTALIVLLAIFFSTLGKFLSRYVQWADVFSVFSLVLFGVGIVSVFFRVWQAQNRKLNFRNDNLLKNLRPYRWIKKTFRSLSSQPTYAHDPARLQDSLIQDIKGSIGDCASLPLAQVDAAFERYRKIDFVMSCSATCRVSNLSRADDLLAKIALCFLKHECWVQYTACTRHPIEFLLQLKKAWEAGFKENDWLQVAAQIIAVDAYSPHFGFTDTIHDEATKRLTKLGVKCITAKASYAGVHTAAARAFNIIKTRSKEQQKEQVRKATLVIYEGPSALVELESVEQYHIFVRHLFPSERLWGGMFTFVVESAIREQDLALLRTYTDLFIDLGGDQNGSTRTSDEGGLIQLKPANSTHTREKQ